jgi:peroxiredoxin
MFSSSVLRWSALLLAVTAAAAAATATAAATELEVEWTTPKQAGQAVPSVSLQTRTRVAPAADSAPENPFDWKTVTTADLFANKRVVLFSVPGAFTPTCSNSHLPAYEAAYSEITAAASATATAPGSPGSSLGVDDVYCLSVNDAFVMRQWGLSQGLPEDKTPGSLGFRNTKLLPDGAAAFTRGMGMSVRWDETERGFGERSWRYSMVVDNGVIEKIFVEQPIVQNSGPDPFEVSDAATMLDYLKSAAADKVKRKEEL